MRDPLSALISRLDTTRLVTLRRARGRRAVVEGVALLLTVVLIGVVDVTTGYVVTFGVFYLIPVAVATIRCGAAAAIALAGISALIWVRASRAVEGTSAVTDAFNLTFRFTMLLFVVTLLTIVVRAFEHARASDRRSSEFLSFAAHQLRTPTASVSATAQGLLAKGQQTEDEEALVRLVSESNRIGRLVSSILRFLRLEQGDPEPSAVADLGALCAEETLRWSDLAVPLTIELRLGELPKPTFVNAQAVQETLGILLENASRHARARIVVSVTAQDDAAEVRVLDDGPGIPPGEADRAFAPFVALDGRGGSGLGLAIAQRLMDGQGGSLRYDAGAFVLSIPRDAGAPSGERHRGNGSVTGRGRAFPSPSR